jgi:hypothetical protein
VNDPTADKDVRTDQILSDMLETIEELRMLTDNTTRGVEITAKVSEKRAKEIRQSRIDHFANGILNGYIFALKMNPEALMPLREKEPHGPMLALVRECYDLAYLMESERERRIKAEAESHD